MPHPVRSDKVARVGLMLRREGAHGAHAIHVTLSAIQCIIVIQVTRLPYAATPPYPSLGDMRRPRGGALTEALVEVLLIDFLPIGWQLCYSGLSKGVLFVFLPSAC